MPNNEPWRKDCAVSTGGASLEIIANYIKGQSRPS